MALRSQSSVLSGRTLGFAKSGACFLAIPRRDGSSSANSCSHWACTSGICAHEQAKHLVPVSLQRVFEQGEKLHVLLDCLPPLRRFFTQQSFTRLCQPRFRGRSGIVVRVGSDNALQEQVDHAVARALFLILSRQSWFERFLRHDQFTIESFQVSCVYAPGKLESFPLTLKRRSP